VPTTSAGGATNAPPNDNLGAAINIVQLPGSLVQDVTYATSDVFDPFLPCVEDQGYHSVWYRYVPAQDGTLSLATIGSDYDTVLAVWSAPELGMQNLGCNDDSPGLLQSQLELPVTAGSVYYIEVTGYDEPAVGSLHLTSVGPAAVQLQEHLYLPVLIADR